MTSLVVGLSENYFAAFAVQSGHSALQSGLLVSLPLLFAAFIQYLAIPYFKTMSVSDFVKQGTLFQSTSLISLALLTFLNEKPSFAILLFLYSIYWLGHFAIQPVWNRWISEIIPKDVGQDFFSTRTKLNQTGIIAGLIIGGLTLHLNVIQISIEHLFFSLFLMSFIFKICAYFSFSQHQPIDISIQLSKKKMLMLFKKYFLFFKSYGLFNFSVYFSAPFVAGYLLKDRNLNYLEFMIVMLGLFAGKVLTSVWLSLSKKQIDPTKMMFYGGLVAAPLPAFWPLCNVQTMFILHVISGIAWAFWEVGILLCFFKNISADEKMETISVYNYIGTITQVLGTCFGAMMIYFVFKNTTDYVFILAGVVRLICVLPLRRNKLAV